MSIIFGLPFILFSELFGQALYTIPSILIASTFGTAVFTRMSSRRISDAYKIQLASATSAFFSGTLRVAFGKGDLSFVPKALLYSMFSLDSTLAFILPVAVAVLAGAHFKKNAMLSGRRIFTLCVVLSLGTIVHVRWSQAFWQNPAMFLVPSVCTYIAVLALASALSHRPVSSNVDNTRA